MSVYDIAFMAFAALAFAFLLLALYRTIGFLRRNRQPDQDPLNPFNGPILWSRFFRRGGYGEALDTERARIARTWVAALVCFLVACALFVILPAASLPTS